MVCVAPPWQVLWIVLVVVGEIAEAQEEVVLEHAKLTRETRFRLESDWNGEQVRGDVWALIRGAWAVASGKKSRAQTFAEQFWLLRRGNTPPTPHLFSDLRILKGFKSNVLDLRMIKDLQTRFMDLRILKGIQTDVERLKVKTLNV